MIHIGIASYISDNINVFICWSVNNIDIQHAIDFNLPINYIQISSLSFGEECIVFYTIIYIYILNLLKVFKVIAGEIESDGYSVYLFNVGNSNCIKNGELTNSVSISCISDYNPYYVLNILMFIKKVVFEVLMLILLIIYNQDSIDGII